MRCGSLMPITLGLLIIVTNCGGQAGVDDQGGAEQSGTRGNGKGLEIHDVSGNEKTTEPPDLPVVGLSGGDSSVVDRTILTVPPDAKFVAPDGDDSGPGTELQPWRNILSSFQKLNPGDTLVIRGGTYTATGSSTICLNGNSPFGLVDVQGSVKSWTTIMGYPGERPKLYHPDGWQTLYICNCSYVRVQHLEVFGDANSGNQSPANGVYINGSHHVVVQDVWSHDNGGSGISSSRSNHIRIHDNRVWGNSHWNPFQTSGVSIFLTSNDGGGDNPDGYSNYITENMVWNNYEDDSIGVGQTWGVTDGNGIIIDVNIDSSANGRTLIKNNILVDNGGPGIMLTRSHAVDIIHNTLFENVRTRIPTVVDHGEIGCFGSHDIKVESNLVVPRNDNPHLFQDSSCEEDSYSNNVWVRTGESSLGASDIVLPTGARVLDDPRLNAPSGCWTPVGQAQGSGAQ